MSARDFFIGLRRHRPVPVILQQERSECGLAAIAMVACHFGKEVALHALRNRVPAMIRGASLKELVEVARELHLIARPLQLEIDELRHLRTPAILHWRMSHFVLLVRTMRHKAVIHDPAVGRRIVTPNEIDRCFTGVAVELTPAQDFTRSHRYDRITFMDFVGSLRYLGRYLALMLVLLVTTQILVLVPPIVTQMLIDEVVLGQDRIWLYRALLGLAAVMLVGVLLDAARRWIGLYAGTRLAVDSTLSVLDHLLSLPVSFLHGRHLGDLMSKLESMTPIRTVLTDTGVNGVVQLVVMVGTLTIMFIYSPGLTFISVGGLVMSVVLTLAILPASRRRSEEGLVQTARQNSSLLETLSGYNSVKAMDLAAIRLSQWQRHFFAATNAAVRQSKLSIYNNAGNGIFAAAEQVLFLTAGINGILDKQITIGVLFAFLSLRGRFAAAVMNLLAVARGLFMIRVHMDRISDILLAKPEESPRSDALRADVSGSIEARGVSFAYPGERSIIRDFSCTIGKGESVAIAGASGVGKTTLLRLLAAQVEPTGGQILYDGRDSALWNSRHLRRHFGIVLQNDRLFQGSIGENIAAFDPEADLDRMQEAAIQAEIWHDIQAMPMTIYTLINDTGASLSGGQVQRILLARALYRCPRMLFLDEATSHLDLDTERHILGRLANLGITIVSVTHRPNVLAAADSVIELG